MGIGPMAVIQMALVSIAVFPSAVQEVFKQSLHLL